MKRNWFAIIAGYLLVALFGIGTVLVGTAFARAWLVRQTLTRAERMLQAGRPGAALTHLDHVKGWAVSYTALEKRRLCMAVRCHAMRMDVGHAARAAEDAIDADTDALALRRSGALDFMLSSLVELVWLRADPGAALSPWSGYTVLIRELRRTGQGAAVDGVLREAASRFPAGRMPEDVRSLIEGVSAVRVDMGPAAAGRPRAVAVATGAPSAAGGASDPLAQEPPSVGEGSAPRAVEDGAATAAVTNGTTGPAPSAEPAPAGAPGWGIVCVANGHSYNINGKFRRMLSAGTVVEVRGVRDTEAGRLAICRLTDTVGPSVLVPVNELDLRPGRLADASLAERRLRARRAVVTARMEKSRRPEGAPPDGLSEANPHAAAYRKAKADMDELQRRAAETQARWESATGGERIKIADELREMKGEQVRLDAALAAARDKAEAWAATHPEPAPESPPPPVLSEAEARDAAELAEIDKQLEAL